MQRQKWILASDIDNTLTGNPEALKSLGQQISQLRKQGKMSLFLTTGRTLQEVLDGFENEHIPEGDAIITQVGTEIYLPPFSADQQPLLAWKKKLLENYSREEAVGFIDDIEGAEIQPGRYNTDLKVSYFLEKAPDPEAAAQQVMQRINQNGQAYQVIWSSGKHLDILPAASGKGKAIRFLIDYLNLEPLEVIAAGDSGNDRTMFEEFESGIVVANAQPELKRLKGEQTPQTSFYFAQKAYAAGVEEGLRHFGVI